MNFIGWIVLGALAGWLATAIMKEEGGLIKNILLGVIGALIGGGIVDMLGGSNVTGFNPYSFLVAVLGAVVVIYIVRLVRGKK